MQPDTETLAIRSQLSPFKVGAIQQLIADGDADLGKKTAPYFAIILVLFLLAFLGYFVTALVALVVCRLQIDSRIRTRLCTCNHCISLSCSPAYSASVVAHAALLVPHTHFLARATLTLQLDATAMDAECAEETYIWLYVFIVLVLPTIVGVLIGELPNCFARHNCSEKSSSGVPSSCAQTDGVMSAHTQTRTHAQG